MTARVALPPLGAASAGLRAALKRDPELAGRITALLSSAGAVLNRPPEEVLFCTGFERGDATPGRLDAALAELRAALFLAAEGFEAISPEDRAPGKTADLSASRAGERYLFEVRWVRDGFGDGAVKRLTAKCVRKAAQLGTALKRRGLARGGMIFVCGGVPGEGLARSPALQLTADAVLAALPNPGRHVCLVRGARTAVAPPWRPDRR